MVRPLSALRAYRRLKRYRQVAFTLAKYGFGDIASRIGIVPIRDRLTGRHTSSEIPTPQRFRMALVDLGPTFVKFGQLLSTRPDVLPERYILELAKLQDEVSPFPASEVGRIIAEELGGMSEAVFKEFNETPVASGSIAQVHRARLQSGELVAVKIQRPGIRRLIETDLAILFELTALAEKHIPEIVWLQPVKLVDQFARTIRRELDFEAEAQSLERFRRNCEHDPTQYVPPVYWDFTTEKVLTAGWVDGVKITNIQELEARGFDRRQVARNGARSILRQVFEHHLFHADPHPGNFFVIEGNTIAAVDFGIVGKLDEETAEHLAFLMTGVLARDVEAVVEGFEKLGVLRTDIDIGMLKFDVEEFIDRYYGLPLERLNFERVISDLLQMVRRHRIILPTNLALLGRMLAVSSGVGRMLDPEFNIVEEARPFVQTFLSRRLDPRRSARKIARTWRQYQALLRSLPSNIEEITAKLRKGEIVVSLQHEGLNRLILEIDRASNRLSFALIVAALVVASSLLIRLQTGPFLWGFPVLGVIGYLIAALLGLWLILAIIRSGRI